MDKDVFQVVPKFKSLEEWATDHVLAFIEYPVPWDIMAKDTKMRLLLEHCDNTKQILVLII